MQMRGEEKDHTMDKSVRSGVEVSAFLNELAKSIAVYCADLEDYVVKSLSQIHEENGAMSKAIADNLSVLSGMLLPSHKAISLSMLMAPARGPKSMLEYEQVN